MIRRIKEWVVQGKMPWRLCIARAVIRGFWRNPTEALKRVGSINIQMKSVYRFKLHIHGKDFLKDFMREATALGMRPFLLWGTLLGYMREGKFIEHDFDIDMAILQEDYKKKDDLIHAMIKRGYLLRHDVPYSFSLNTKDRLLHLDVDLLYFKNGKLMASMPSEETGKIVAYTFKPASIGVLQKKVFLNDVDVWVPEDPEKVLTDIYGEWKKPAKEYDYRTGPRNRVPESQ